MAQSLLQSRTTQQGTQNSTGHAGPSASSTPFCYCSRFQYLARHYEHYNPKEFRCLGRSFQNLGLVNFSASYDLLERYRRTQTPKCLDVITGSGAQTEKDMSVTSSPLLSSRHRTIFTLHISISSAPKHLPSTGTPTPDLM